MWYLDPQASVARTPFYTVLGVFAGSPRHLESLRRRASKRAHISMLYSPSLAHRGGDREGIWFLAIRGPDCNKGEQQHRQLPRPVKRPHAQKSRDTPGRPLRNSLYRE
jgi:hypothetical protein